MRKLYQTFGSGEMRSNAAKAYKMAKDGPVVILNRTAPQAVMISPEMWDFYAARLDYLDRMIRGDEASKRIQAGEYDTAEDVDKTLGVPSESGEKGGYTPTDAATLNRRSQEIKEGDFVPWSEVEDAFGSQDNTE